MWQNRPTERDHQRTDSFLWTDRLDSGPCKGEVEDKKTEHEDTLCPEFANLRGPTAQMSDEQVHDPVSKDSTAEVVSKLPQVTALGTSNRIWREQRQRKERPLGAENSSHDTGTTSSMPPPSHRNNNNDLHGTSLPCSDPAAAHDCTVTAQPDQIDTSTYGSPPFIGKAKQRADGHATQQHSDPHEHTSDNPTDAEDHHPSSQPDAAPHTAPNEDSPSDSTTKNGSTHTSAPHTPQPPHLLPSSLLTFHPHLSSALTPSPNWSPGSLLTSPTPAPPNTPAFAATVGGIGIEHDDKMRLGMPLTEQGLEKSIWRKLAREREGLVEGKEKEEG